MSEMKRTIFSTQPVQQQEMTYTPFSVVQPVNRIVRNLATPKQIEYYATLLHQRGMPIPDNLAQNTYEDMDAKIKELMSFYPASESQKQLINRKISELQSFGININKLSEENMNALTGGRNGTANSLIEKLLEMEKKYQEELPPNDQQIKYIAEMFFCPDVDFESYGINLWVYLNETIVNSKGVEVQLRRQVTIHEFKKQILENMSRQDAAQFLDRNRVAFNQWKRTRIRPEQMRYIRSLEERLSNFHKNPQMEWITDIYGNLTQQPKSSKKDYTTNAYIPYEEFQLIQLSQDDATKMIEQLQYELRAKELYRFEEEKMDDDTQSHIRSTQDKMQWAANELKELNNFIHAMEAKAGIPCEAIHVIPHQDLYTPANPNDPFFKDDKKKSQIVEYMQYVVESGYIKFNAMKLMCQRSETAMELFEAMTEKLTLNPATAKQLLLNAR